MPDAANQPGPAANPYDEVPYESNPFVQTHPDRLATVATLFNLRPAPVERCRVLELGCAAGGNLVPMAEDLTGSEFVGIDYSARQIAEGRAAVEQIGLTNIDLRPASIMDVDESYGQFDYVIAHGVFSWVPTPVQEKILQIAAERLNPNGVAYVSYNTYPGWHMRGMIRDMMRYHAERFNGSIVRTRQARALLDFLAQSVRQDGSAYSVLLKTELETLRHQADHYLFHEHLEEVNDPIYFHQFAERAQAKGLQYLGEARLGTMVLSNFGPDVEKTLRILATDQVQVEQYMDFLRNRMFRETLLVPQKVPVNWNIQADSLRRLFVASPAVPASEPVDLHSTDNVSYRGPSGMSMQTNRPLLKAAMRVLREAWPGTVPFDRLRARARELLGVPADPSAQTIAEDQQTLALGLLNCYMGSDLVELHAYPLNFVTQPGERPVASPYARLRAAVSAVAPNRRHEIIRLSDLDRHMLPLLDGTNDRAALVDRLTQFALNGALTVQQENETLRDPARIRAAVESVIEPALANLARNALLVG